MWIKKEEYERLKMAEYERDIFAKELIELRNKLAKKKETSVRKCLGDIHAEQQKFPLDDVE